MQAIEDILRSLSHVDFNCGATKVGEGFEGPTQDPAKSKTGVKGAVAMDFIDEQRQMAHDYNHNVAVSMALNAHEDTFGSSDMIMPTKRSILKRTPSGGRGKHGGGREVYFSETQSCDSSSSSSFTSAPSAYCSAAYASSHISAPSSSSSSGSSRASPPKSGVRFGSFAGGGAEANAGPGYRDSGGWVRINGRSNDAVTTVAGRSATERKSLVNQSDVGRNIQGGGANLRAARAGSFR
eukprot:CAMPEP_0196743012 /NCGR_PEP_ID=MMETSP1091-20130531/50230_1 /TAXON_ID=302021 /ORGANISM="Rhodomonas sp., Strain CCMP768" /LENGTH=237 /DNA_ID=CAMNT_0042089235 /DNA_START=96 /DNA_END=805 /DNA_ORIENTATION=+